MKIIDIRGNLIKIESTESIEVSSLLKISENNQEYLAQVLYSEMTGATKTLFAKILSHFATPLLAAEISNVSTNATCEYITTTDLIPNFGKKSEVVIGELTNEAHLLTASKNFFDQKVVIVSELAKNAQLITENFVHQIKNIDKNSIIFDIDGSYDGIKLTAGKDFKLPLNEHAIQFIYDKYFADITEESKAQVSDIFKELKEYASTVPYIPFKTFKAVIDDVFNYSQNISLFFFKTKLDQLNRANVFANSNEEIMNWASLSEFGPGNIIIDLSKVGKIFVSEYISLVVQELNKAQVKLYAFVKLEDSFTDKDFLKELLESDSACLSYIIRPDFKFLTALKQNCASYIITGDVKKCDNFDYCKFLLKNLGADKYILTGNFVSPVSLIFNLKEISEVVPKIENLPETTEDCIVNEEYISQEEIEDSASMEDIEAEENSANNEPETETISEEDSIVEPETDSEEIEPISSQDLTSQYEEVPVLDNEVENSELKTSIEDYAPTNIFSDEENEEDADFSNDAENIVSNSQNETTTDYEELVVETETEENATPIEDYVPSAVNEEEHSDNIAEIEDYVPAVQAEEVVEESIQEISEQTLEEAENITELSEETFYPNENLEEDTDIPIFEEDEEIEEPIADSDIMEKDLELEFSLDEPEVLEPILDNEEEASSNDHREYSYDTEEQPFEDDIEEDESPFLNSDKTAEELLDEQIKRDVDKVYMASHKEEDNEDLSEDDLDFIEELVGANDIIVEEDNEIETGDFLAINTPNNNEIEPENDEPLMPIKNTATPAVPIYSAEIPQEAIVHSDPIQQGDRVIHVKFGIGVVEKIFSYGTKNFCSINFENIGRKVLDPNVTELKRA